MVPKLFPGETIVCVASGPSLQVADVEVCRGRTRMVVVNDGYRLAPWADALYAADVKWWRWHAVALKDFRGLKFSIRVSASKHPADVRLLERTGETGLELVPTGLRTGRNSGYQAINLAVHLGARRILLLGYDMRRAEHGAIHWFGDHPDKSRPPLSTFLPFFQTLVKPLAGIGVEIINCSRQTALTCFPQMALEDALAREQVAAA